jgi:glycosyltransferase involved in cell wall biosynthesis
LVFPEGNIAELRHALRALLASAELRTRLGQRAREFALVRYALAEVARRYQEVFEQAQHIHCAQAARLAIPRQHTSPKEVSFQ